jgi:hypothetical protein
MLGGNGSSAEMRRKWRMIWGERREEHGRGLGRRNRETRGIDWSI